MKLPGELLDSLKELAGFDEEPFIKIHQSGKPLTSIRLNPRKPIFQFPFEGVFSGNSPIPKSKIPWTEYGYYLEERPSFTFDPLFHAGCYYVQEASSMFLEQALKQAVDVRQPLRILDLSAAPGGKSTHIESLMSPGSLLVSNEVIRSRARILEGNIIKWGCRNVIVSNNDPGDFAKLESFFDVIVVDAPCSGSGLFRKDEEAIQEWSRENVQLCSQRQKRILADVWPALRKDGILIYSTCSYSREEDEDIVDWLIKEFGVESLMLRLESQWGIIESSGGYRFWPDKLKGEGFFLALLRKPDGDEGSFSKSSRKGEQLNRSEKELLGHWIDEDHLDFVRNNNEVYAWPSSLKNEMQLLLENLRLLYSGVRLGGLIRDKFIPDHALAMSEMVHPGIPRAEVNYDQAIGYLRKEPMSVDGNIAGWQLVSYQGQSLGWINGLKNRINNYYPKELRILKDR